MKAAVDHEAQWTCRWSIVTIDELSVARTRQFWEIEMHDLAIRNARICDGTGQPMFDGEIAVVDGRIAEIGDRVGPARAEVDAGGQVIAPGIIDNHTHYDAQITWDPYASPTLGLGVTTLLMGNCGFTIAPCRPQTARRP